MRFFALLLLLASTAFAQNAAVNCASATLGQTYSTSSPSLQTAFKAMSYAGQAGGIAIANPTNSVICATLTTSGSAPATFNAAEHCTTGTTIMAWDNVPFNLRKSLYLYLRADGADCTTGTFYVDFW